MTIRSARDTFREEICGLFIDWLKDLANGKLGSHPTILRDIICEELCKEWRKPSISKKRPRNSNKDKILELMVKDEQTSDDIEQDNTDYMSDDDIMVNIENNDNKIDQYDEFDYSQSPYSGGDYEMAMADDSAGTTEPMDEDDLVQQQSHGVSKILQLVDDFKKKLRLDKLLVLDLRLWKEARAGLRELYVATLLISPEYKKVMGM